METNHEESGADGSAPLQPAQPRKPKKRLHEMGGRVDPNALLFFCRATGESIQVLKTELERNQDYGRLLNEIHERRRELAGYCACRDEDPAQCFTRIRHHQIEICRSPGKGREHAPDCGNWVSHSASPRTRAWPIRTREVLTSRLLNQAPIHLSAAASAAETKKRRSRGTRSRGIGSSSLAGELLLVLDTAGVNQYDPGTPTTHLGSLFSRLFGAIEALAECRGAAAGSGAPLPRVVHAASLINLHLLPTLDGTSDAPVRPAVLIGSLRHVRHRGDEVEIFLEGESLPLRMAHAAWQRAVRESPSRHLNRALKELGEGERVARVLGAFAVTVDRERRVVGHRAGLCVTTRELVPVESSFELIMANHLVAQKRKFVKDIFLPEGARYRHDFRLMDLSMEFIIEVNGMETEDYLVHKQEVQEYLEANFPGGFAIWWAVRGEPLPVLPPPLLPSA